MKTSLKNAPKQNDQEPVEPVADDEALAELGETAVGDSASVSLALGSVSGSIDSHDLIIPRLNIVQNVGPLSEEFEGGALVFNKVTVLAKKDEPIHLTVLSIKKYYEEVLPYDPNGPRPRIFDTLEELKDAGLWAHWEGNNAPPAREVATALILIEKPDMADDIGFSHRIEEKDYALAMWTLRGTAYSRAAKKIFSSAQIELAKDGLMTGHWELMATRTQSNGNYIFVPVLKLIGKHSPEFVASIKNCLSS